MRTSIVALSSGYTLLLILPPFQRGLPGSVSWPRRTWARLSRTHEEEDRPVCPGLCPLHPVVVAIGRTGGEPLLEQRGHLGDAWHSLDTMALWNICIFQLNSTTISRTKSIFLTAIAEKGGKAKGGGSVLTSCKHRANHIGWCIWSSIYSNLKCK